MRILKARNIALTCAVIVTMLSSVGRSDAVISTTGKQFLYWSNGIDTTAQFADHVSVVVLDTPDLIRRLETLPPELKAVVPVGWLLDLDTGRCSLIPNAAVAWSGVAQQLTPHLNKIAAIQLDDEPDLRVKFGCTQHLGAAYLERQRNMANLMDQLSSIIKYTVPGWEGVNTWVNYGTEFRNNLVPLAQHVDWSSFDCYGPFDNCSGEGLAIPTLVDIMASKLPDAVNQEIFLVSDASCHTYDTTGRRTHESELFLRGLEYWQLAATHPRVKGMVGFLWEFGVSCNTLPPVDSVNDINDSPGLSSLYRSIGLNLLTGAVPAISSLSVPTACDIPAGSTTCTINVSWTTTSGPNLRLFGRLVGNPDVVSPPLCPGATSCSIPAGAGDYIFELRENEDSNSKLIFARQTEVRYANGAQTGQITFTPSICKKDSGGNCGMVLTANVQNAPAASFFLAGSLVPLCPSGRTNYCGLSGAQLPPGGPHWFTVQLRANPADPNSVLDQRTFAVTVI